MLLRFRTTRGLLLADARCNGRRFFASRGFGLWFHLSCESVFYQPIPRREILTSERPPVSPDVLGLFVGRHLLERTHADAPGAPGAIFLFRRNLLRVCADREELEREIRITVQHEVGHLLGLDEDDLEQWGLA